MKTVVEVIVTLSNMIVNFSMNTVKSLKKIEKGKSLVVPLVASRVLPLDDEMKVGAYRHWTFATLDVTVTVAPMTNATGVVSVYWCGDKLGAESEFKPPLKFTKDHVQMHVPINSAKSGVSTMTIPGPEIYELSVDGQAGHLVAQYDVYTEQQKTVPYVNVILEYKVNGLATAGLKYGR